ncbi:sensor histidine kinase [Nocardia asteroides]|uniref:sensor histidine kinase n=1 Tax=Nocardia asteroides TaxID=1824 RepID=UPI00366800E4
MTRETIGVRARLLIIVLIPSIALLAVGTVPVGYLIDSGRDTSNWADMARTTGASAIGLVEATQQERQQTLLQLAGDPAAARALAATRKRTDIALQTIAVQGFIAAELRPDLAPRIAAAKASFDPVQALRLSVDTSAVPFAQVLSVYNRFADIMVQTSLMAAGIAPTSDLTMELYKAVHALRASESFARASSLGMAAWLSGGLTKSEQIEFSGYVGDGRGEVAYARTILTGARQKQLSDLTAGLSWQQLTAVENAILLGDLDVKESEAERAIADRRDASHPVSALRALPLSIEGWQLAITEVRTKLLAVWDGQARDANTNAHEVGADTARSSLLVGIGVALVTLSAFLAALILANRLIGRMRRLRRDTLELADERLPDTIRKLGQGHELDSDTDLALLDFGRDELGQVADAFNRAHGAAIAAAVAESKTRTGVNAVFLNIAHRSQVIVHRQLELLDHAERNEENPAKLDSLFKLDHLATRARRNAENLIVLGGELPGRRWRNPVPLMDVVRSAMAESLDYARIHTSKLPDVHIDGAAVTDLIHLLAELTDNASAFSPPGTKVDITATVVGRGVAIEISDQGLGMSSTERAERNAMLSDPPDFSVAALSNDSRLGLFVVGKLAARHSISVRLAESDYGGIKAIVVVPATAFTTDDEWTSSSSSTSCSHRVGGPGGNSV